MDPIDPIALTRALVDIDSTTGREGDAGRWLAGYLRGQGFAVTEQPVDDTRINVLATSAGAGWPASAGSEDPAYVPSGTAGSEDPAYVPSVPRVMFSTHFDCVPPFFPSRVEGERIYGRGACDAKGILAAQVAAADRLRRAGETRVGMLFVVGEERGSDGARVANDAAPRAGARFLVNGEPTDNRMGLATRGILRVRLKATGRAAHSSFPELGESAIDKLIDALIQLRSLPFPDDPVLGRTHYTVGLIAGGVAPNVVSPAAEAEVMFRTVSDAALVRSALAPLEPRVAIEHVLEVPPAHLETVAGFDTAVFPYTTDIPFLDRWGEPLLFGPGSIHVAHTATEFIDIPELHAAIDAYVAIARDLLSRS